MNDKYLNKQIKCQRIKTVTMNQMPHLNKLKTCKKALIILKTFLILNLIRQQAAIDNKIRIIISINKMNYKHK